AHPDGRTCWKHEGTCVVGKFEADTWGLHDVVGNVWEWTSSYFGDYPWPHQWGRHYVYRGGSWSRRFEKWLRPNLRNRLKPSGSGSHLGVRCVATNPEADCPYGRDKAGECQAGVDEADCLDGKTWNGVRCARAQSPDCPSGTEKTPGFGCVRPRVTGPVSQKLNVADVKRQRSPQFDADCAAHTPQKPRAFKLTGGGHLARNAAGAQLGCKNRDVGVGWNSACCP
ncbi:MAG: formylglycine-generating enzyme family protein, partial [Polyangiaceae bacterium]|nr:formylglycine-generating enzyme family protein [Polyangiaceae bacterium]